MSGGRGCGWSCSISGTLILECTICPCPSIAVISSAAFCSWMKIETLVARVLVTRNLTAHDSMPVAEQVKPPVCAPRMVNNFMLYSLCPCSSRTTRNRPLRDAVPARTLDPTTLSGIGFICWRRLCGLYSRVSTGTMKVGGRCEPDL